MATHSFERALARMGQVERAPLGDVEVLTVPRLHRAMGEMLETLLGQALAVRDAPPVLRTFARTSKHLIPSMVEAMANVPEEELASILRYVAAWVDRTLAEYEGREPATHALPPPWDP
jgi:hypothetical protein